MHAVHRTIQHIQTASPLSVLRKGKNEILSNTLVITKRMAIMIISKLTIMMMINGSLVMNAQNTVTSSE